MVLCWLLRLPMKGGREGGSRENHWILRNNTAGLNLEPGVWRGYFLGKPVTRSLWDFWIYSLRPGKFCILHYEGILACFCDVVHAQDLRH